MNAGLARGLARHRPDRLSPADWVTLARATLAVGVAALVADSFEPARAERAAGVARGRRARPRRGRRMGRAAHEDGGDVRRALRRRGRRVPDPRPQRVRRPLGRRVGAGDRRGALRVPRGRVAAAVDAQAAPAAPLAQGRRGDAGDRADDRGRGRPAAGGDPGRARRRARPARRVVRPRRVVAVDAPVRHDGRRRHAAASDARPGHRAPTATHRLRAAARRRRARTGIVVALTILAGCCVVWAALVAPDQPTRPEVQRVPERPARGPRPHRRWRSPCRPRLGASWPGSSGRCSRWWSS